MAERFFLFIIVFIAGQEALAQHPFYYNITDEDGLPSNEVYQVIQDDFGYIWIGCDAGLFRYDGFTFKPYTANKQNGRSISYLQLDKKGRVWCKNFSGQIYRVQGDSLFIVKDLTGKTSSVPQFTLDDSCNLYVNSFNSIVVYNEVGDSVRAYSFPERKNVVVDISELIYFKGKLFLCRNMNGFFAIDLQHGDVTALDCEGYCDNFWNRNLFKVMDDQLYILAENTNRFSSTIGKVSDNKIELLYQFNKDKDANRVYMIYADGNKKQWLCSYNGVSLFSGYRKNEFLLPGQKVSSMLHDREGNYWFTTLEHGLFVIPFMEVMRMNSNNSTLGENNFTSLAMLRSGNLLAGSYTGEVHEISLPAMVNRRIYSDEQQKFITVKKIRETKNYLLVSRGRFTIIDKRTGKVFYPPVSNFRDMVLAGDTLFFVMPEAAGKIHINDLLNNTAHYIPLSKSGGRAIEHDTLTGSIYFALNEGTYIYKNGKLQEVLDGKEKIYANALSVSGSVLWVASVSNGIYGISNGNVVNHYTINNGLQENTMRHIKAGEQDVISCSGNTLYRINIAANDIARYTITSGINPKDINAIEVSGETVFLATNKGLTYFPLSLPHINPVKPGIAITGVFHGNDMIDFSRAISLPYRHNNLKIVFSSAAFRSRGNFKYEYRLKELDTTWIQVPASVNYAVFSSMPPGDFLFEVRAVNESGIKSLETATLQIHAASPVWQQWWFYLLITLLSIALVVLIYQLRIRFLTRRAALENKITASRLTALKAQMNPHFMYNALNSIQDLILQSDIKNTNYYLSRFSSLMRKVLDASGSNEIVLADELEMLGLYLELEKLRFGDEFAYTVTVAKQIDRDELKLPAMMIQLFVENAIKHGLLHKKGEKRLSVEFLLHNNTLTCIVADNGVGRKRSMEIKQRSSLTHESFATKATEQRLELINSSRQRKILLEVIDLQEGEKAVGTKVILVIPL